MAEERSRRTISQRRIARTAKRAVDDQRRHQWLQREHDMLVEQIARRETDIQPMKEAIDVLERTIARFELDIRIYQERLERIDDRLARLEMAEERELEMGPENNRFADMTIADAAYEVLKEAGRGIHVKEIWEALSRGGLRSSAQRPTLSVTTALLRDNRFRRVGKNTYAIVGTQPRLIDES